MKKTGYLVYMFVGAALVISGFATMERGLKEANRQVLETVAKDREAIGNLGFNGYNPLDYKIAFSDGKKDVVCDYNGGDYVVSKREAVYGGLVGSIYQNGDVTEVVVPDHETWQSISSVGGAPLSAVIWHESFHAYQNDYCGLAERDFGDIISETELADRLDNDDKIRELYQKELEILGRITDDVEYSDAMGIAGEYLSVSERRDELLSQEEKSSEAFYEMTEGTAYYVEASVVRHENGEAVYHKDYIDTAKEYTLGNAKYYRHGMLECMLLDKLSPDWKSAYSFDVTLDDLLLELSSK